MMGGSLSFTAQQKTPKRLSTKSKRITGSTTGCAMKEGDHLV
ncbi:hypothetical protein KKJFFJLC_00027 [Vibrio phage vB_VpaS_PGB]|nr:hypothetical protein HHKILHMN_00007 [Vibrio phage vB_VpaS_PGA]WVH05570.1 hypothetical protein KKJFFJLC_00027 [Vibrio phage vB_VpaS_PGB]